MRAVQVESGTFRDKKMRPINLFESGKNHAFDDIWSILLLNDNGKISRIHFKTSCMTLVKYILIFISSYHRRAKTGLRPRFYLNCSHMMKQLLSRHIVKLLVRDMLLKHMGNQLLKHMGNQLLKHMGNQVLKHMGNQL